MWLGLIRRLACGGSIGALSLVIQVSGCVALQWLLSPGDYVKSSDAIGATMRWGGGSNGLWRRDGVRHTASAALPIFLGPPCFPTGARLRATARSRAARCMTAAVMEVVRRAIRVILHVSVEDVRPPRRFGDTVCTCSTYHAPDCPNLGSSFANSPSHKHINGHLERSTV